jgi:6 kDa early secretory antigenic target
MDMSVDTVGGVTYNVDPAVVADAASFCSSTATEVSDQLSTLASFVESMADYWVGPAATTFNQLMAEYQAAANGIELALTQISQGLNGTSVNYSEAEATAVAAEQRIQITTGGSGGPVANLG